MKNRTMSKRNPTSALRRGFTLVEVLTVIVIIGILAAISVPAIGIAMRAAKRGAIRLEIDNIGQALEAYKLEYGEYPPDFYVWNQVESHFRKAFPNIDNNELRILSQFTHYRVNAGNLIRGGSADPRSDSNYTHYPHAIDRAEALVFCLGGFSNDKTRPFTGPGGPLTLTPGDSSNDPGRFISNPSNFFNPTIPTGQDFEAFQYNTDRETGFFDFQIEQLSLNQYLNTTPVFTYSNDEVEQLPNTSAVNTSSNANALGIAYYPDPFPTYRPRSSEQPVVYFHSQNYNRAWGVAFPPGAQPVWYAGRAAHSQNLYLPNGEVSKTGVARPYASNNVNTNTPPSAISGFSIATTPLFQFAENNRFQLISAGLDGNYGGLGGTGIGDAAAYICIFPTGGYYNPFNATASATTKYQDDLQLGSQIYNAQPQLDNITNFSTSDLESDLP